MNGLVSVIIVTFNADKYIDIALQSVLNQTYSAFECIIVDGLSIDNTIQIIKQYASKDDRINYLSEKDNGIYDAMNKGWKMANGEWIIYLGADDELLPNAIANLMNYSDDSDIVYGNTILKFNTYQKHQISKLYHRLRYGMCCCHQSIMMKKELFRFLNGFDLSYKICADYDLVLRAYLNGYKFYQTDKTIAIFNMGGLSSNNLEVAKELYIIKKSKRSIRYPFLYYQYEKLYCRLVIIKHKFIK